MKIKKKKSSQNTERYMSIIIKLTGMDMVQSFMNGVTSNFDTCFKNVPYVTIIN